MKYGARVVIGFLHLLTFYSNILVNGFVVNIFIHFPANWFLYT